jgi:hypothetical protein
MYMVTSKPKRISVYSGLLHMVFSSISGSAVGDVHRHFETETHFGVLGLAPHGVLLDSVVS